MEKFKFNVTQNAVGYFGGKIEIEASSKEKAILKLKNLTDEELEELVYGWTTSDLTGDGRIEVWDNMEIIN